MSNIRPIRTALTLGLTASGTLSGIGLALSAGTIPILLLSPTHTLLKHWRALYNMGLWAGPSFAAIAAGSLGYGAWRLHEEEEEEAGATTSKGKTATGKWKVIGLSAASCAAIVPFTWVFLVGTSASLLRESEGGVLSKSMSDGVLRSTIKKWAYICGARALLPLWGTALGIWGILGW